MGLPSPRLNWLLAQLGTIVSALVSALILVTFRDAIFSYLSLTLAWIFASLLLGSRFPLPAALTAMVSALGMFAYFHGTVGDGLRFYVSYEFNMLIGGFSVVVVHTLLWPANTPKVFLNRLTLVYARLEERCSHAAQKLRSGESLEDMSSGAWAPFRELRPFVAPELRRGRSTRNPFARMILACRSLNLRLRFFDQWVAANAAALSAEARQRLAGLLNACAARLHALLQGLLDNQQASSIADDLDAVRALDSVAEPAPPSRGATLFGDDFAQLLMARVVQDVRTLTTCHNALGADLRRGVARSLAVMDPPAKAGQLVTVDSLHATTKLVVILSLLLLEEGLLGFPGGSQVAFYATFFASTGNLGRQNKTDLVGLAGLLIGFAYGVVAAFLTSRMPHFPLLLALVFLGQFLASVAFQRLPRISPAGLQAGLAIPFSFLATTGPEWGSFGTVRTRFAGLVVAGCTAVVVHAYLWPVLPMRQLRASIIAALRDTATSIGGLFSSTRAAWPGPPPRLSETVTRSRDLLDDASYLPGPDHADPAYGDVLLCLQEIDADLDYVHFLIGLEAEHPLRQRFFDLVGDYPEQARHNLEIVADQIQWLRAAAIEPVHWAPNAFGRWEQASRDFTTPPDAPIDPWRPAVIAQCLDHLAAAATRISNFAAAIARRDVGERAHLDDN